MMRVELRTPHPEQRRFVDCIAKRRIARTGRRGGKTTGVAILAVQSFLTSRRILYAVPTDDQKQRFWYEVKKALREPIELKALYKNETTCIIEMPGTETRIRAKTAYDPDTLRGDYADLLILDEFQLMKETVWDEVGAPMLLDNDGDAVFCYTPPSIRTAYRSRARNPRHAAKMFKKAQADKSGRWAAFHFTSHSNPFISRNALGVIAEDMTPLAYRQEILAEDVEDNPGALWKRDWIDHVLQAPNLLRVVVAVDPPGGRAECGIVTGGFVVQGEQKHWYTLADDSLQGTPDEWGKAVVTAFHRYEADTIVAEANYGGEMVTHTIHTVDPDVPVKVVHATRGKQVRAEPVSVIYSQGRGHHVGSFPILEDELCQWEVGQASPNRLDALVWGVTETMFGGKPPPAGTQIEDLQLHKQIRRPSRWRKG